MTQVQRTRTPKAPQAAVAAAGDGSGAAEAGPGGSKTRRVAFRVLAALTSLWVLALMVFALTEVVFMWLPRDTLLSVGQTLDLGDIELAHRAHFMSLGVVAWALLLGVAVQLRRPARREAPMLHALAVVVGAAVVFALHGTFGEWLTQELTLLVPLVLLALLHPRARQLVRRPTWNRAMTALAAVAAVPWLFFAVTQAQLQWRNVAGDAHADMEHWAAVALLALLVVACGFIGATNHTGWRLTAWIAAIASLNYGLHSLIYPEPASAASTLWAVAATAWGIAYAATIIHRSRLTRPVM